MTLGIVLSTARERGDFGRVVSLARAALARGLDVSIFLMADGVHFGADPTAAALIDEGCDITACGTNVTAHRVPVVPGVLVGSQDDHAALVDRSHRLVSFT